MEVVTKDVWIFGVRISETYLDTKGIFKAFLRGFYVLQNSYEIKICR